MRMRPTLRLILLATAGFSPLAVQPYQFEVLRFDANPAKGFQWPYYLSIPAKPTTPVVLLVEGANTGVSDDLASHDSGVRSVMTNSRQNEPNLGKLVCPMLMPVFPRPASYPMMYTHALDRDTLATRLPKYERLDLQLVAMIDDARDKLAARGLAAGPKVFLWGYSAGGTWANRFTILHPDRIRAVSLGGCSAPTVPVAEWKGVKLPYPIGVADLKELTGEPFNLEAFRNVPMQIFRGDMDTNDEVAYPDGYEPGEAALVTSLFGGPPPFLRYPRIEMLYLSVGAQCRFFIEEGTGHNDLGTKAATPAFFERYRSDPAPPIEPVPLSVSLYFPHASCRDGWETEIVLGGPLEGAPVRGSLAAYAAKGGEPLGQIDATVRGSGCLAINVCRAFNEPQKVEYLVLKSASGFVNGFARHSWQGGRTAVAGMNGGKLGLLPVGANRSGVQIVFVNVETAAANLNLAVYDDGGAELAAKSVKVEPGAKLSGSLRDLFQADLPRAATIRYSSDRDVAAAMFTAEATSLEGMTALPGYTR